MPSLLVDCSDSLYNYENSLMAVNLEPYSLYELKLLFHHKSGTFRSFGIFKSDNLGQIDLKRDAPVRGTYTGVRSMGLFESYVPLADFPMGGYAKFLATEVWNYELRLSDLAGNLLDTVKMTKRFMDPSVHRKEIEEGNIRGTLFVPEGKGPFPGILEFSGGGGGINEQKAAALASEGFCVLCLPFFGYKDLVKELTSVQLEYFLEATEWFSSLAYVMDKIGIHANSLGGMIAFLMAKETSKICAIVSINPPHAVNHSTSFQFKGEMVPAAPFEMSTVHWLGPVMCFDKTVRLLELSEESDLHFEQVPSNIPVRFVVSMDDLSTSVHFSVNYMKEKLQKAGCHVETDWQSGGHLMEPPCFPHHEICWTKISGNYIAYGGEPSQHGASQSKVWASTVDFLKKWVLQANSSILTSLPSFSHISSNNLQLISKI